MTRSNLKELGLNELDMDRAKWHMINGTKEFRDFLLGGDADFEVQFARWLKDKVPAGVSRP